MVTGVQTVLFDLPASAEAAAWFSFLDSLLSRLECPGGLQLVATAPGTMRSCASAPPLQELVRLEMEILQLAGWAPDFSDMDPLAEWTPFAIDLGRCGEGARTVRLAPRTVAVLNRPDASMHALETVKDAVRFLGVFLSYHIERPPDIRRALVSLISG